MQGALVGTAGSDCASFVRECIPARVRMCREGEGGGECIPCIGRDE